MQFFCDLKEFNLNLWSKISKIKKWNTVYWNFEPNQKCYSHPLKLFPIQIDCKISWIKIDNGWKGVTHKRSPCIGQKLTRRGRKDAHQLFERFSGFSVAVPVDFDRAQIGEIRSERSVVKRIVPTPIYATLEIIGQNPT